MYVIQTKWKDKWEYRQRFGKFKTVEAAQDAFDKLNSLEKISSRIAQEYTVTRYKEVKTNV